MANFYKFKDSVSVLFFCYNFLPRVKKDCLKKFLQNIKKKMFLNFGNFGKIIHFSNMDWYHQKKYHMNSFNACTSFFSLLQKYK